MTGCLSLSCPRYRILLTVQHCVKNPIIKTPKQLCCRELRTYFVPNWSLIPTIRHYPFEWRPANISRISVLSAIRNDAIFYTGCKQFSSRDGKSDEKDNVLGEKEMTGFQKMKYLLKNYWYVAIPVHLITSLFWLGSFYYLSVSGIDVVKLLESLHVPDFWVEKIKNTKAAHFVTMYALYKLATPFRYAVTIGGTTVSINFLRQKGWIKPVPTKDKLKKIYQEQKGAFRDFKASCQDKIQSKKGDFLKTKEIKQHYVEARDELQKSVIDTRREIKQGAKELSSECKHVGGLLYKSIKQLSQTKPKADYVAKLVKDTGKK